MFSRRSQSVGFFYMLQDVALTVLAFLFAYWVRSAVLVRLPGLTPGLSGLYPIAQYWPLMAGILVLWPLLGYTLGIYHQVEIGGRLRALRDVAKLVVIGIVLIDSGLYLLKAQYISRSFVLLLGAADFAFLLTGRWLRFSTVAWIRDTLDRHHYFLIVGSGPRARELGALIEESEPLGMKLVGFVDPFQSGSAPSQGLRRSYPVLTLEEAPGVLRKHVVDEVLFAVDLNDLNRLETLIEQCEKEGVITRVQPEFFGSFSRVYLEHFGNVPLLTYSNTPNGEVQVVAKRAFDVMVSAGTLVVLFIPMALIGLLVKISSRGPVFYTQARCGLGGRRFRLYKFRSMVANADQLRAELEAHNESDGPVFKMADDPRCTRVGRWLRRLSLDELPQLWNILRGDMSFVGPRPPLPNEVEQYQSWQRRRLRMRPGLTCLWALEGRSRLNFERWMQLDLDYIDRWSLWLDVKIFLKTIPLVLFGRGAY